MAAYKERIRLAAAQARNELLNSSGVENDDQILITISRALWANHVSVGELLISKHSLAKSI
eukprot:394120-Karenia_brevis.AAC.1